MSSHPAQAIDLATRAAGPTLSAVEAQERLRLREGLRLRRSVDHFARAWYGSIVSLILSGIAMKLLVDTQKTPAATRLLWIVGLLSVLALAGWTFAAVYLVRSRRSARAERASLLRLQDLDERSPKPPELF